MLVIFIIRRTRKHEERRKIHKKELLEIEITGFSFVENYRIQKIENSDYNRSPLKSLDIERKVLNELFNKI